jgi:hypothetical protein
VLSEKQVSVSEWNRQVLDVSRDAQSDPSKKERGGLGRIDVERSKRNVWWGGGGCGTVRALVVETVPIFAAGC